MSRQQRQLDQLRDLCDRGAVARAIDLAFEHFAHFGHDDDVVQLIAGALGGATVSAQVRRTFAELHTRRS